MWNGSLKLLTAKTGHYHADADHFAKAINLLAQRGIDPASYPVLVWDTWSNDTDPVFPCPSAKAFLDNSGKYGTWGSNSSVSQQSWTIFSAD